MLGFRLGKGLLGEAERKQRACRIEKGPHLRIGESQKVTDLGAAAESKASTEAPEPGERSEDHVAQPAETEAWP